MAQETGRLAENIVYFARALRAAGIPVGPGAVLDALAAVRSGRRRHARGFLLDAARGVREAPRALAAVRPGVPDLLSPARLARQADGGDAAAGAAAARPRSRRRAPSACRRRCSPGSAKAERKPPELEVDARLTVSDREVLQKKDFAQMTAAEIAAAKDAIKRLVLSLDEVKTRRLAPHPHGHVIDMRRTLRASLKAGGALIDLKYLGPRDQAAADRGAARYLRLDEPVHAAVPAFPPRGHRCAQARAHVPVRHAADQRHPRAQGARTRTRRWPPARRACSTGRAARASPPRCTPSTSCGRAACSPRARSCCSSPTGSSAIPTTGWPSRSTGCTAPAGG